ADAGRKALRGARRRPTQEALWRSPPRLRAARAAHPPRARRTPFASRAGDALSRGARGLHERGIRREDAKERDDMGPLRRDLRLRRGEPILQPGEPAVIGCDAPLKRCPRPPERAPMAISPRGAPAMRNRG